MRSPDKEPSPLKREHELIDRVRRRLPAPPDSLLVGPGDDAAVVVPERGAFQVVTTDVVVEGVHFDRRFSSLADVGHKALAVNLSDLAAMGATPSVVLLSLVLPDGFSIEDLDGLLDGFLELASASAVTLAGGNISRSPGPLMVDVTAIGYVRPRRILRRGGGKPGDQLYLTGTIGAAAAGLDLLQTSGLRADPGAAENGEALVRRHRRPEPRVRIGTLLGRNRAASACMDLSDGLADAVRQVAQASGTGALLDAALLPVDPLARAWFEGRGTDPIRAALAGGDDFELLFAVPRKWRGRLRHVVAGARGVPITRIGELTADGGVRLSRDGEEEALPEGFTHF